MRALFLVPVLALTLSCFAQDTITVSTLTFDSITARRGTWAFPDASHHYRKVLMLHTLKCDAATTQDQYDCGEWDYLTYHFIHEHTGQQDSTALQSPYFRINTSAPDSVALLTDPMYDQHQHYDHLRVVDNVLSEADHGLATADATDATTLDVSSGRGRTQFLITSDELAGAGIAHIDALRLNAMSGGDPIDRVVVRMKNTSANTLTGMDDDDLLTVFEGAFQFQTGVNTLTLLQSFVWMGPGNNILVDIAVEDHDPGVSAVLSATSTPPAAGLHAGREGHLLFHDGQVAVDPAPFAALSDQITVTFRAFGGADLPLNTSAFEGFDAQGQRVLNAHLPWSDGTVYWDAGNDGYDRIQKAATTAEQEGQWVYWAFTKNATTGQMKIYKNGTLWQSGTGKTKPMSGVVKFNIGSGAQGDNPYHGAIDDFNVFATELDQPTIQAWMGRRVDATHPQYTSLLYGFPFDDGDTSFTPTNIAANGAQSWQLGRIAHEMDRATDLQHASATTTRPDLVLVEGEYTAHTDSVLGSDLPILHEGVAVQTFQVVGGHLEPVDTLFGWEAGETITFDPEGAPIDPILHDGPYIHNHTLDYFSAPFERIIDHEIGRYITPYGIGLSLGANGFTWAYDVTDYQHLLHDSVDVSAGNQQELIDLRFLMIEGTPPREVVDMQYPWGSQASYSYHDLSDDAALPPVNVPLSPDAHQWMLRSRLSGHGDASSNPNVQGCCEFHDNTHMLYVNGAQVDSWHIWQTNDCALNPVYPQGGTWLYSREGWCPGDIVKDRDTELTPYVTGNMLPLDYRITPVPASNPGWGDGNYQVNMDLFEFSAPTHTLDAEIYDVKRPSDAGYRSRENPICYDPLVTLRNAGGTDLTSATLTYSVSGGTPATYTWTGLLKHMQKVDLTLPIPGESFWNGNADRLFHVTVSAPNGDADTYADNDSYTTHFLQPTAQQTNFIVKLKTNNRPEDNELTIRDIAGNVVLHRANLTANTTYKDTLDLAPGCYTLDITDSGNDGLKYWADPDQGTGSLQFTKLTGPVIKTFQAEFGRSIHYSFSASDVVGIEEMQAIFGITAAPNPSNGRFRITADIEGPVDLVVLDAAGHLVKSEHLEAMGGAPILLDLGNEADGLYLVRLSSEGRLGSIRLMKN